MLSPLWLVISPLCAKPVLVEHLLNAKTRLGEPVPTVCQDLLRCCMLQTGGTQILMPKYKGTGQGGAASGGTCRVFWELETLAPRTLGSE